MQLVHQVPSHLVEAHFNTQAQTPQTIQVDLAQPQVKLTMSILMDKILLGQLDLQVLGAHSLSQA